MLDQAEHAVPLGQDAWAAADLPGFAAGVARVGELAARVAGQLVVLRAAGRTERDAAWLEAAFDAGTGTWPPGTSSARPGAAERAPNRLRRRAGRSLVATAWPRT